MYLLYIARGEKRKNSTSSKRTPLMMLSNVLTVVKPCKLQTLRVHGLLLTGPAKSKLIGLFQQKEKFLLRKNKGKRGR